MTKFITVLMALSTIAVSASSLAADDGVLMYVGTYTGEKSKGIYAFRFDSKTGKATSLGLAAEMPSPSFLAVHPSGKYLYAVSEISEFAQRKTGAVAALAIGKTTGKLKLLNKSASGGAGPCHLVVDNAGRNVLVANYGGGSVASIGIDEDGSLRTEASSVIQHKGSSVNPGRQREPHAHSINLDAANKFAVAADLGTDKLYVYKFDAEKGSLAANDPPDTDMAPGSGPRHFAFHPTGKYAYAINELLCTMTALSYDAAKGTLNAEQTISTLPPGDSLKPGYSTAEVVAHPSGTFLYGSNRGHDTIVVYTVDSESGKLTYVENESTRGKTPRNFVIDPSGKWLLAENQSSDTIAVFAIDEKTGALAPHGDLIEAPSPVCIRFVP